MATKLHVPQLRHGRVGRDELVRRLVAGSRDRKLTLLCAPAGSGKTVLLSQWHASDEEARPFAWVSLDPADDEPGRFWAYVVAALGTVDPGLAAGAQAVLPALGPAVDRLLPLLINDIASSSRHLVLVLDDYHFVRHRQIHETVDFLLRHLPEPLHLAIAARAEPPLPLGALRASAELTEIRAADLGFDDREADALLNGSLRLGLDAADVRRLVDRTEGWAAGLRLAALSLQTQADRKTFVETFAGDDRQIVDYLHDVLLQQPVSLRDFLLKTSILERMCGPLCDAVTGRDDGAAQLEQLYRSNLFMVALDTRAYWYRYHHLFRDLLRHELRRVHPELVTGLHRRACEWHRAEGDAGAIAHATAAGVYDQAAALIAEHSRAHLGTGQTQVVSRWIEALPEEEVLRSPELCLVQGWIATIAGRHEELERWARAAESGICAARPARGPRGLGVSVELLLSNDGFASKNVGGTIEAARAARAVHPDERSPACSSLRVLLALALYYAGDPAGAEAELMTAWRRIPPGPEGASKTITILACLATIHTEAGHIEQAELEVSQSERLLDELGMGDGPWLRWTLLARAKLHQRSGDLAAADELLTRALESARARGLQIVLAQMLIELARVKRASRRHDEARSLVRQARRAVARCPDPGALRGVLARTERALGLAGAYRSEAALTPAPDLGARERAVLRLLASGLSQREIAAEQFVSFNTVKTHTRNLYRKLGVATRADAVARGREIGLL